jgi:hypothetical protein
MSKTFTLGNETFTISTDLLDSARRERYFQNPNSGAELTDEEKRVLNSLGIDALMEQNLRPYLKEFFDELPHCTTDASLRLSRRCEVPYYVIWSTEFANHVQKVERVNQYPERKTRPPIVMSEDGEIIDGMKPVREEDDYTKLFTLIPVYSKSSPVVTTPTTPGDPYAFVFTLLQA